MGGAAQLQLDRAAQFVRGQRTSATGGVEETGALDLLFGQVGLDPGDDQCGAGIAGGLQAALGAHAVDPAGVGPGRLAGGDLGLVQQVEDEGLVGGAAVDDDLGLGHRAPQTGQRLVPVGTEGDHLGDHRVEVGGDGVALGNTRVDTDPWTLGQGQMVDVAGSRGEVAVGVLGIQPGLDGVPDLGWLVTGQGPTGGDVELELHQIGAGGHLGDRVLHLQTGVDLEEGEQVGVGLVQELDGAGADVADTHGQPLSRRLHLGDAFGAEQGGGGLLDHLLVAALHGAVAHAQRPGGAVTVRDHLHLDVAGAGDQALQEDDAGTEGALGLAAGAVEDVGQLGVVGHLGDAATTAAGGGLQHQRVADLVGLRQRLVERGQPATAPRGDRHADLLGDQLRADLVPELAHRVRARPDEGDPDAGAQVGEGRVFRDEAPTDPRSVRAGLDQRLLQHGQVEVGTSGGRAQVMGNVRLADEHRASLTTGVQRDHLDRVDAGTGRVQVPHGVDQAHGRLSTVDDGDTADGC